MVRRALVLLALALACAEPREEAIIGLLLDPSVRAQPEFSRAVLDSLARAGEVPPLQVSRGGFAEPSATALASTVNHALRLLAQPAMVAVVGPPSSTEAVLVAAALAEAGLALVVPTATTRKLRTAGDHVFPLAPDDSAEGEFLAAFAADSLRARSATIFHVVDDYGAGLDDGAAAALERRQVRVIDRVPIRVDLACTPSATNPYDILLDASLRRGVPDVMIIAGRIIETACLMAAVMARRPDLPVLAGDGAGPAVTLRAAVADLGEPRLFVVSFWSADAGPRAAAFARDFRARFGREPQPSDALQHDAIMIVADAAARRGPDRRSILRGLRELGGRLPAYEGVTGSIGFGAERHRSLFLVRVFDESIVARTVDR